MSPSTPSQRSNQPFAALTEPPQRIAIIGGGLSGTLVAAHLLQAAAPLQIYLIERRSEIGRGVAYGTPYDCHLLNVPASKMSAYAHEPNHLLRWLAAEGRNAAPDQFLSRRLYGQYLQSVLSAALRAAQTAAQSTQSTAQFIRLTDEALALKADADELTLSLASGQSLTIDRAVLALGNFPPANPPVADPTFYDSPRYVGYPWSAQALEDLDRNDPVLLIGAGLTAVDLVLALQERGHCGKIQILSRRGLLPQAHQPAPAYPAFLAIELAPDAPPTVRALLRRIRQEVQRAARRGYDWRSVIDALRADTPTLWRSLPLAEQRRFLRHLRVYWDLHRHRIAPSVAALLAQLQQNGQLTVGAGRIRSYQEDATGVTVQFCPRGGTALQTLRAARVINCTGSESNYRKFQHPLVQHLLQTGLVRPDALSLGLDAVDGALRDVAGNVSDRLFTIGSPQKGQLWETTAVPEIRAQAAQLAQTLQQPLHHQPRYHAIGCPA